MKPEIVAIAQAEETEEQLIERAQEAAKRRDTACWELGRIASEWTQRFARGRTDADFAKIVGISQRSINYYRRVYERFPRFWNHGANLSFRHLREALNWEDAETYLQWAADTEATVSEMVAFYRRENGLTEPVQKKTEHATDEKEQGCDEPEDAFPDDEENEQREYSRPVPASTRSRPTQQSASRSTSAPQTEEGDSLASVIKSINRVADQLEDKAKAEFARQLRELADKIDPPKATKSVRVSVSEMQAVMNEWNMLGSPFPQCKLITNQRRTHLKARLSDPFWRDNWQTAMKKMHSCPFLKGQGSGSTWVANFDWFIKPESVLRIIEGKYDAGPGGRPLTVAEHNRKAFDEVFGDDLEINTPF